MTRIRNYIYPKVEFIQKSLKGVSKLINRLNGIDYEKVRRLIFVNKPLRIWPGANGRGLVLPWSM